MLRDSGSAGLGWAPAGPEGAILAGGDWRRAGHARPGLRREPCHPAPCPAATSPERLCVRESCPAGRLPELEQGPEAESPSRDPGLRTKGQEGVRGRA
uniref:Uncharacterized protein n=1 Tax=Peromyscus maniculatus bairdii TaxID=230844 RepID=A0A8C8UBD3_PERMB